MVVMARPKRQGVRRSEMVSAATTAITKRGMTGLRIKDVAEEAGLSAGLVSYYYPSLEDLLVEVHEHAVDRFYRRRHDAVQDLADPVERLRTTVRLGIPDAADDPLCTVLYELHLHASRNATHSALLSTLFDLEVSLYSTVLEIGRSQGVFTPSMPTEEIARTAVSLEDAYGLHIIARNRRIEPWTARNSVLRYLDTVLSCSITEFAAD